MAKIVLLSSHRPSVTYTLTITHHWDDTLEVFAQDVADDERSRASVADTLTRAAIAFGGTPFTEADALNRIVLAEIDTLMGAAAGTSETAKLAVLADAVSAYEAKRLPFGRADELTTPTA